MQKKSLGVLIFAFVQTFSLNAQYQLNGDALDLGNNTYQLTPNTEWKRGSVFFQVRHHLDSFFRVAGAFNFGALEFGADGIVFVMQDQCLQAGSAGGGMGYENIPGQSIGVEFDTYQNIGSPSNDPVYDHLALHQNGSIDHLTNLAGPSQIHVTKANVEDGLWYNFIIEYDPQTQLLEVFVEGNLRLSHSIDLKQNVFGGSPFVYWGFTSATGGHYAANTVRIDNNTSLNFVDDTICSGPTTIILPPLEGTNIAFAKASNSSSNQQGGSGPPYSNYAFDGNSQTAWSSAFVDSQWISVDLGIPLRIDSVLLNWENAYGVEYKIQYSNDFITWTDLYHETAGNGGIDVINFASVTTRYVRMLGLQRATPYGYSLYEMEVWSAQQYIWTPNDGSISDTSSNAPIFSPTTTTTYSVQIPDACLGSVSFDYTVYVIPNNLQSNIADTVCASTVVDLNDPSFLQNNSNSNLTIWLDSTATIPALQTDSITASAIYYVVAGNGYCQDTLPLDIVFADVDTLSQSLAVVSDYNGQPISCSGAQDGSISSSVLSPTTFSYVWSDGQSTATAYGLGSGWYFVTVTDAYGCAVTDSLELIGPNPIQMDSFIVLGINCYGDSSGQINVYPSGGQPQYQFNWSNATGIDSVQGLFAGNTYLTVTDVNGCTFSDVYFVPQAPLIEVDATVSPVGCDSSDNGSVSVTVYGGAGNYSYNWNTASTTSTISNLAANNYLLTVTDAIGCSVQDSFELIALSSPVLNPSISLDTIFAGNSATVDALSGSSSTAVQYNWTYTGPLDAFYEEDNAVSTLFNVSNPGNYNLTVQAVSIDSCVANGQLNLVVLDYLVPQIPTAFSPNDDGFNDLFEVIDLNNLYIQQFKIFNRWSNELVDVGQEAVWDGTANGVPQAQDVYFYLIIWQLPGQEQVVRKGTITLMR